MFEEQYLELGKLLAVFILAFVLWFISRNFLLEMIHSFTEKSRAPWDDYLRKYNVFKNTTLLVPVLVVYLGMHYLDAATEFLDLKVFLVISIMIVMIILIGVIKAFGEFYESKSEKFKFPVKGYIQFFTMLVVLVGTVLIISFLQEISLWKIISGLGAASAILMYMLKDTFSSFAASLHLLSHDMARIGDMVEVHDFHADGTIEDITLYNVKIRNWSNSVINIPLAKFVESTFVNWQSIDDVQSRRMMRNLYIDLDSIQFCSDVQWETFQKDPLITGFLRSNYGTQKPESISNFDLYRAYVIDYLGNHKDIYSPGEKFIFMISLLESTPHGLPLQVYVYTKIANWVKFEELQSEVFAHLLVMTQVFDLRHYQHVSSNN